MKQKNNPPSDMPLPEAPSKAIAAFACACGILSIVLTIYHITSK